MYYPEVDNEGVVPGFVSENDRYRKEAVLNLNSEKNQSIFALEQVIFFYKDLSVNTTSLNKKIQNRKRKRG